MRYDNVDYGDFGMGWWLYFGLIMASKNEEDFRKEFIEELEKNFLRGDDVVGKQNGQTKKRVAVRKLRKQIP